MRANLLSGRPVVSCQDGTRLGTVDRVYIDPKRRTLAAFAVVHRHRLRRPTLLGVVRTDDVCAFGPDAVTVTAPSALRQTADASRTPLYLVRVERLLGRTVITSGGTSVGRLTALSFDRETGRLAQLEVKSRTQPVPGLVWADEVLSLDREQIIVAESVLASGPIRAGTTRPRPIAPTAPRRGFAPALDITRPTVPARSAAWATSMRRAG